MSSSRFIRADRVTRLRKFAAGVGLRVIDKNPGQFDLNERRSLIAWVFPSEGGYAVAWNEADDHAENMVDLLFEIISQ